MESHQEPDWHVQVRTHHLFRTEPLMRFDSFTGLTPPQTKALAEKAHVYMTADGRISMAGLNGKNIEYFAQSVDATVKGNL